MKNIWIAVTITRRLGATMCLWEDSDESDMVSIPGYQTVRFFSLKLTDNQILRFFSVSVVYYLFSDHNSHIFNTSMSCKIAIYIYILICPMSILH